MPETQSKYGILVGVDGSPESDAAVRWAAREAVLRSTPATLMHVVPPGEVSWSIATLQASIHEAQEEHAKQIVEQALKTFHASVGESQPPEVRTEVRHSVIVTALRDASREAQMTVIGSRGMGAFDRAAMGAVSGRLLHHAYGPVAVVHADEAKAPDCSSPVVLGIDGSSASDEATTLAFDEAARRGVDLIALHAWSDVGVVELIRMDWEPYEEEGRQVLHERLAGCRQQYPTVNVRQRLVCDHPARWLIDESQQAQLVVVGSHGRGGFAGMLLGSVSTKVAEAARSPVIVVRPR